MKNLSLTFFLVIAALFGSVGSGFALPKCPGSPFTNQYPDITDGWNNCVGKKIYEPNMSYYLGVWKFGKYHGQGIRITYGSVQEGIWKNGIFQYAQKPPVSPKLSLLHNAFKKLSKENRKQLQSNLKGLGFYKSSIDGLYGKGTARALTAYNKQNLNGADLKKSKNIEKLFNVVLGLKTAPKTKPTGAIAF